MVGVADTRLTGISEALDQTRKIISQGGDVQIIGKGGPFGVASTTGEIINVLDNQLANGLGSGTGVADAVLALKWAQRHYKGGNK